MSASGTGPPKTPLCCLSDNVLTFTVKAADPRRDVVRVGCPTVILPWSPDQRDCRPVSTTSVASLAAPRAHPGGDAHRILERYHHPERPGSHPGDGSGHDRWVRKRKKGETGP